MDKGLLEVSRLENGNVLVKEISRETKTEIELVIKYEIFHYFSEKDDVTFKMLRDYAVEKIKSLVFYNERIADNAKKLATLKELMSKVDFTDKEKSVAEMVLDEATNSAKVKFEKRESMLELAKAMIDVKIKIELEDVVCACCKKEL